MLRRDRRRPVTAVVTVVLAVLAAATITVLTVTAAAVCLAARGVLTASLRLARPRKEHP